MSFASEPAAPAAPPRGGENALPSPEAETPDTGGGSQGIAGRVLRASALIILAHVLLKFLSPIQYKLLGFACDEATRELFVFGFEGILLTFFFVGEEALGPAFLPIFMAQRDKGGEASPVCGDGALDGENLAWRFAGTVLVAQTAMIALAVAAVALFPRFWVELFTDWGPEKVEQLTWAPSYARYMIPALLGISLASTTYMMLNGYKRFFLAAAGDAMVKLGLIGGIVAALLYIGRDAEGAWRLDGRAALAAFAIGLSAGGLLKLAVHLAGLRDGLHRLRVDPPWRSPAFRAFLWLMLPLLAGILFAKIRDIFNNIWILSTLKEQGLMADAAFGRKLYQTLGYLIPYACSIALFPFLCEMVDRREEAAMGRMLGRSARVVILLATPVTALAVALSLPMTRVLFQGGQFQMEASRNAAVANACYSLILPAYALEMIFMQAFFAKRRMVAFTLLGIGFSSLSMLLSGVAIFGLGWQGRWALAGVALSVVLARTGKVVGLALLLRRSLPDLPLGALVPFALKSGLLGVGVGLAAWGASRGYAYWVDIESARSTMEVALRVGPQLLLGAATGCLAFVLLALVLCRRDASQVVEWTRARLGRARAGDAAPDGGDQGDTKEQME